MIQHWRYFKEPPVPFLRPYKLSWKNGPNFFKRSWGESEEIDIPPGVRKNHFLSEMLFAKLFFHIAVCFRYEVPKMSG